MSAILLNMSMKRILRSDLKKRKLSVKTNGDAPPPPAAAVASAAAVTPSKADVTAAPAAVKEEEEVNPANDERDSSNGDDGGRRSEDSVPCKVCKESFGTIDELVMHAKIEHTPRKHKLFSNGDIEYFLKVYSKLKKSNCPICHKAILNTFNWRAHMEKHCMVKDVPCRVCGKRFSRQDHRRSHEKRHTVRSRGLTSDDDDDEEFLSD